MKKLNLNSVVKVKLNEYGKDIFYHQFDKVNEVIKRSGGKPIESHFPEVDDDGYTEFQLWYFMHIYGEYMMAGMPEVLDGVNIYIEDEDLDEVVR